MSHPDPIPDQSQEKTLPEPKAMRDALIRELDQYNYQYDEIENPQTLTRVYRLFILDEPVPELGPNEDPILYTYIGAYYEHVLGESDKAKESYLKGIEAGCPHAMGNLSAYYEERDQEEEADKYLLMAIEKGNNSQSMRHMAYRYREREQYEDMARYFDMAIAKGDLLAMFYYGEYHEEITEDYEKMKTYYQMAANGGLIDAMAKLSGHYEVRERNYLEGEKYLRMAVDQWAIERITPSICGGSDYPEEGLINALAHYYWLYDRNLDKIEALLTLAKDRNCELSIDFVTNIVNGLKAETRPPILTKVEAMDPSIIICHNCHDYRLNTLVTPCRHAVLCHLCAKAHIDEAKGCPICQTTITGFMDFLLC